jgi:hypothetical protein
MSSASSARILRKLVHPASVKRTVRDIDDLVEGKAVAAHDALDIPLVAKRRCPSHPAPLQQSTGLLPNPDLLPLTSDIVLLDRPSSVTVDIPEEELDILPHLSVPDHHSYWNFADFTTLGRPVVRVHQHAAGLTELHFVNCIVKVRVGNDLDDLIRCSANGAVALRNLSTNGWVTNCVTVLPSFVFLKYLSGFDRCL